MFPKKKRAHKRPSIHDDTKFVSVKAETRYETEIIYKNIITERGFFNPGGRIQSQIEERSWQGFTTTPSSACVGLVREFYANALERSTDNTVFVRGKWIAFNSTTINRIYGLPDLEYDQYTGFRNGPIDPDQILRFLCGGEEKVQWKRSGSIVTNFPAAGLDSASKAWHYFISARLLPSGNTSEVTRERAILNYAIQNGFSIDIGRIIFQSLLHTFQAKTPVSLGHPSVIHDLCMAYSVDFLASEEILAPKTNITRSKIFSYSARSTDEPEEGPSPARASSSRPSSSGRHVNLTEQMAALREDFQGMRADLQEHNRWHARKDKRELQREKRDLHRDAQETMYRQYMVDYHQAQSSSTPNRRGYPDPPRFSDFQEEEGEEEEEQQDEEEEEGDDYEE